MDSADAKKITTLKSNTLDQKDYIALQLKQINESRFQFESATFVVWTLAEAKKVV